MFGIRAGLNDIFKYEPCLRNLIEFNMNLVGVMVNEYKQELNFHENFQCGLPIPNSFEMCAVVWPYEMNSVRSWITTSFIIFHVLIASPP